MDYTEKITLVKITESQDNIGNITHSETTNEVYAKKNVVGSKEFYNAVAVGITPTAELQIRLTNYNDEEQAIYNDKRYFIVRTIPKGRTDLVLVLGTKTGVN